MKKIILFLILLCVFIISLQSIYAISAGTCSAYSGSVTSYCPIIHLDGVTVPNREVIFRLNDRPPDIWECYCVFYEVDGQPFDLTSNIETVSPSWGRTGYYMGGIYEPLSGDTTPPLPDGVTRNVAGIDFKFNRGPEWTNYLAEIGDPSGVPWNLGSSRFYTDVESLAGSSCADACSDSDGGKNYLTFGSITWSDYDSCSNGVHDDECADSNVLIEQFCSGNKMDSYWVSCDKVLGSGVEVSYSTGAVCNNNRCECPSGKYWNTDGSECVPDSCSDTDGANYRVEGTMTTVYNGDTSTFTDYCPYSSDSTLTEYSCNGNYYNEDTINCNYVDKNGNYDSKFETKAVCSAGRCDCPSGSEWKSDGRCGKICNKADSESNVRILKSDGYAAAKITRGGTVFLEGNLVQNSGYLGGGIRIGGGASLNANGNMYITGKVYDALYTGGDLSYLYGNVGPFKTVDGEGVSSYIKDNGDFYTESCIKEGDTSIPNT